MSCVVWSTLWGTSGLRADWLRRAFGMRRTPNRLCESCLNGDGEQVRAKFWNLAMVLTEIVRRALSFRP